MFANMIASQLMLGDRPAAAVQAVQIPEAVGRADFSREQLSEGVWGHDVYFDERTVDVHVGRLRKAINRER